MECIHENSTLSTHFMKWVDLNLIFVCTHFHTTLPFKAPPFHTQIWTSWLLHFFLNSPPRDTGKGKSEYSEIVVLHINNIVRIQQTYCYMYFSFRCVDHNRRNARWCDETRRRGRAGIHDRTRSENQSVLHRNISLGMCE